MTEDTLIRPRKFCDVCGSPLKQEWQGEYDEDTGGKVIQLICSKKPCSHTGHYEEEVDGFFKSLFRGALHCKRCGMYGEGE